MGQYKNMEDNILSQINLNESDLNEIRVIQRDLVYVIGIPLKYAKEELLRTNDFFGQFGEITKLIIKTKSETTKYKKVLVEKTLEKNDTTVSAYITFLNTNSAYNCIVEVDETKLDGKVLRCTYGTTKYCTYFLRGSKCQNLGCMYLHKTGEQNDVITKDVIKNKLHNFKAKNAGNERIGRTKSELSDFFSLKGDEVFIEPKEILFKPSNNRDNIDKDFI